LSVTPPNLIPGTFGIDSSVLAVVVYGCRAAGCLPEDHRIGDRQFANITWSDADLNEMATGVVLSQAILNTIVAHECLLRSIASGADRRE